MFARVGQHQRGPPRRRRSGPSTSCRCPTSCRPSSTRSASGTSAGPLPAGTTAHPKFDPVTGEMHVMAYNFVEPYLWYHVVDAGGHAGAQRDHRRGRPGDGPRHGPDRVAGDRLRPAGGVQPRRRPWPGCASRTSGTTTTSPASGLMPRAGSGGDTVWVEVDPCYVFHPLNAYDADDGTVVIDLVRHPSMFRAVQERPRRGHAGARALGHRPGRRQGHHRAARRPRPRSSPGPTSAWPGCAIATATRGRARSNDVRRRRPTSTRSCSSTTWWPAPPTEHDLGAGRVGGEFVFVPGRRRHVRRGRGLAHGLRLRPAHRHQRSRHPRRPRHDGGAGRHGQAAPPGAGRASTATGSPTAPCVEPDRALR